MLAATATFNMFAIGTFALLVAVRVFAKERAYSEACIITYILVALAVVLKVVDLALPIALTAVCFPDSALPPFNSTLVAHNCAVPCMVGDLYAAYGLYMIGKVGVGLADLLLSTGFLVRKPRDWYRGRQGALSESRHVQMARAASRRKSRVRSFMGRVKPGSERPNAPMMRSDVRRSDHADA